MGMSIDSMEFGRVSLSCSYCSSVGNSSVFMSSKMKTHCSSSSAYYNLNNACVLYPIVEKN